MLGVKRFYLLFVVVVCVFGKQDGNSKRFLVDGSGGSGSSLVHLENNQQVLSLKLDRINATLNELTDRNNLLENANKAQDNLIHQLQNTISQLQTNMISLQGTQTEKGATYVRWGKRHCPSGNVEELYSGYAGGQQYSGHAGPAGMLCFPDEPEINGTSYRTSSNPIFGMEYQDHIFKSGSRDEDVPCALCNNKDSHGSVMIPGRKSCYPGWKREYYGYLASGAAGHTSSDYICVDMDQDFTPGGSAHKGGKELFVASIVCGSMPCPPYRELFPLHCVVCSK